VAIPTMVVTKLLFYCNMAVSIIEEMLPNGDGGVKTGFMETSK